MLNSFHNPDILTCLANLSSDEVFTPPNVANQMLDALPSVRFAGEKWQCRLTKLIGSFSKVCKKNHSVLFFLEMDFFQSFDFFSRT